MAKKGKKGKGAGGNTDGGAPRKRKTRKEMEEEARKLKEQQEEEARKEEERKKQAAEAKKLKKQKEAREAADQNTRDTLLKATCQIFRDMAATKLILDVESRTQEEWRRFVDPHGLPSVNVPPAMNTYLYLWRLSEETSYLDSLAPKVNEVLGLLDILDSLLENPLDRTDESLISNWREVRQSYRDELQHRLDLGCFHVVRDMERCMKREGLYDAHFNYIASNYVVIKMYTRFRVPAPPMKAPKVACEKAGLEVMLPEVPFGEGGPGWLEPVVVRLMRLRYDHFSDLCSSWQPPNLLQEFEYDLHTATLEKWMDKLFIKRQRAEARRLEREFLKNAQQANVPWWIKSATAGGNQPQDDDDDDENDDTVPKEALVDEGELVEKGEITNEAEQEEVAHPIELEDGGEESGGVQWSKKLHNHDSASSSSPSESNIDAKQALFTTSGVKVVRQEDGAKDYESQSSGEAMSYSSLEESELMEECSEEDDGGLAKFGETLTNQRAAALAEAQQAELPSVRFKLQEEAAAQIDLLPRRTYPTPLWDEKVTQLVDLVKDYQEVRKGSLSTMTVPLRTSIRRLSALPPGATTSLQTSNVPEQEKTPTEILEESEVLLLEELQRVLLFVPDREDQLNLRKYRVIGGVYYVDLAEQPPQEYVLVDRSKVKLLVGDYILRQKKFTVEYRPPAILESEDKEDAGAEKSQASNEDINRLVSVDISLPEDVLWFDPPTPVQWDPAERVWTNRWVFDSKYNEDKRLIQFHLGSVAGLAIGLAAYRFSNLPYQTWELKPQWKQQSEDPDEIVFMLTANVVIAVFNIRGDKVCLKQLQNATGSALEHVLGQWYDPHALIRIMRNGGADIFPDYDSFLYIEGSAMKDLVVENHLYHCMALLSPVFNFTWSRWNLLAGPRKLVLQMREYTCRKKLPNYCTLLVRRDAALLVDCNEVSASFSEQAVRVSSSEQEQSQTEQGVNCIDDASVGQQEFFPDLHALADQLASPRARYALENPDPKLVETTYFLLKSTKVMSYS